MYVVEKTGEQFASYMEAVKAAQAANCNVTLDGNVRWSPAPPVSAKKIRRYNEQKAAHAAQLRMTGAA